ncbi:MAG: hypothetical protein JW715_16875 [Sedimentisphaerales bacterium]|nr:hypothetical protein [Sedimentisphaerales bacterium]
MKKKYKHMVVLVSLLLTVSCFGEDKVVTPDLTKIIKREGWGILNREAKVIEQDKKTCIHFDGRAGLGGACLETLDFSNGVIECDIKGNIRPPSYVGIAFDVIDTVTFDAIYFRAFNFKNEQRKEHSVQYISHPEHTWQKLREKFPGKYESAIEPAPDPNGFFHVKLIFERPKVSVYVNDAKKPCLVVEQLLSTRKMGKIALFVDNESEGIFANLKIIPKESKKDGKD